MNGLLCKLANAIELERGIGVHIAWVIPLEEAKLMGQEGMPFEYNASGGPV